MATFRKLEFDQIIEGWKNLVFPNEEMESLAKERIKHCFSCDKLNKKKRCILCGCYMPSKVRTKKGKCYLNPPKWT